MPAVAQISVDFGNRGTITNPGTNSLPSSTKVINPLTLAQYLLYNRELTDAGENFGLLSSSNLKYEGGFITAGDRINVKHDSDLQLRQSLEVGQYVQTEYIVSRTKENTESYESIRQNNNRTVTISPRKEDIANNYFSINTSTASRSVKIYTLRDGIESSLTIDNKGLTSNNLNIKTTTLNAEATNINISGNTNIINNLNVTGVTSLTNYLNFNTTDNSNSNNRRITGLRRLVDIAEFNTSTYDDDALSVGDFKKFGFKSGMIMLWSGSIAGNLDGANGLGVGPLLGWALCNGSNGTPDLRNRFVVGAGTGSDYTQGQADVRANPNNHNHGDTNNYTLVNSDLPVNPPGGTTNITGSHRHTWGGFTSVSSGTSNMYPTVLNTLRSAGCTDPTYTARFAELQERGAGGGEVHDSGVTIYQVSTGGGHSHTVTIANEGGGQGHKHTINTVDHRPNWYALCYIMKL